MIIIQIYRDTQNSICHVPSDCLFLFVFLWLAFLPVQLSQGAEQALTAEQLLNSLYTQNQEQTETTGIHLLVWITWKVCE